MEVVMVDATSYEKRISGLELRVSELEGGIGFLLPVVRQFHREFLDFRDDTEIRLERIEGDVSVLKGDVSVLKGDVSVLKGDVSVLKGDVSTIKGTLEKLPGDIVKMLRDEDLLKK